MTDPIALARDVLSGAALHDIKKRFDAVDCAFELARGILSQHAQIERLKAGLREALEGWTGCSQEVDYSGAYRNGEHAAHMARVAELRKLVEE